MELAGEYGPGFGLHGEQILRRFLRASGPVTRAAILDRYAFDEPWLDETLARWVAAREVVKGHFTLAAQPSDQQAGQPGGQPTIPRASTPSDDMTTGAPEEYCDRGIFEQLYRRTVALLRREVQPVSPAAYADFLLRWQGVRGAERAAGPEALRRIMGQLRGLALPGVAWERDVLPARLEDYRAGDLDALCAGGELVWVCAGVDPRRARTCASSAGVRAGSSWRLDRRPIPPA